MSERSVDLEARLAELAESLRRIDQRVSALERAGVAAPGVARRPAPSTAPAEAAGAVQADAVVGRALPLVGRTLLVLAGAFVLRALTDSGAVPAWLGVGLGFTYAGTWIAIADRAGRAGRSMSAGFHGLAAVLIGFPLLFEAASRFRLLGPVPAAAALTLLTAVALAVAARRSLQGLAWVTALGGIATAVALGIASRGRIAPATLYLVLLGVATLWLGYVRDWVFLRWPVAVVADLMAVVVAVQGADAAAPDGPRAALLVLAALIGLYLAAIAARTLVLGRKVVPFELVQAAAVVLVGLGGAVFVATRTGMGRSGFGIVTAAFGAAAYAVAFAFVERRQRIRANFYFYSTVAVVLVLAGTGLLLSGSALALLWAGLCVVAAAASRRQRSLTLGAHAAAYAVGAAVATGLLPRAVEAAFVSSTVSWTPSAASVVVLVAVAASAWLTGTLAVRTSALERIPQLLLVSTVAVSAMGVAIAWLVPVFSGADPAASAGAVATVRTAVLVAGTLLLAWTGRLEAWMEAGWLAYPALAVTGLKIVLEDVPRSRPATLFLSFGMYGAALILVPRLRGRRQRPAVPAPTPPGVPRGGPEKPASP